MFLYENNVVVKSRILSVKLLSLSDKRLQRSAFDDVITQYAVTSQSVEVICL